MSLLRVHLSRRLLCTQGTPKGILRAALTQIRANAMYRVPGTTYVTLNVRLERVSMWVHVLCQRSCSVRRASTVWSRHAPDAANAVNREWVHPFAVFRINGYHRVSDAASTRPVAAAERPHDLRPRLVRR